MRELSYAQDGDLRRPNDSVAFAVVAQMAAPGNMSDDQDVSPRSFRCPVQQFRNISAVDDDLSLRAHVLLEFGHLFGRETCERLLPLRVDVESAGPKVSGYAK